MSHMKLNVPALTDREVIGILQSKELLICKVRDLLIEEQNKRKANTEFSLVETYRKDLITAQKLIDLIKDN